MNISLRVTVAAVCLVGLAACASTDEQQARLTPQVQSQTVTDQMYVGKVEQLAQRRGVKVIWLNPPKRPQQQVASN